MLNTEGKIEFHSAGRKYKCIPRRENWQGHRTTYTMDNFLDRMSAGKSMLNLREVMKEQFKEQVAHARRQVEEYNRLNPDKLFNIKDYEQRKLIIT